MRYGRGSRRRGLPVGAPTDELGIVFAALCLVVAVLFLPKLISLQVIESHSLSEQGSHNRLYSKTLYAKRGTIYDRNGNVLAISVDCKTVSCNPTEVENPLRISALLADHLGGDRQAYLDTLTQDTTYAYVARKVDEDKAERLEAALEEGGFQGLYFEDDVKRDYPYGDVAGQVLGIVGIDGDGLSGLELYYDDILSGEDGSISMEVGSGGTPIAGTDAVVIDAKDGSDVMVSIDVDIQAVAERQITQAVKDYQADSGSVMVIDPKTGEILAACSTPLLPITDFSRMEEGSDTLKLVTSAYEPGSIFKVLTASVGIERGLVTPWSSYTVPARVEVGDDLVGDDDGRDYTMEMTLTEMLRRSSNTGLAMVAQDTIGAEPFASGVDAFGIGHATGIDYPGEVDGIVRTLDDYDGSSLGSMSFGQGLAVPMVQMVRAFAAVANGGTLITPHFLMYRDGEEVTWPSSPGVISASTCDLVIEMMRVVVQEGTAVNAQVDGYDVAGKTGTGEQADESGGYKDNSFVSSLMGFAPASDPEVLVYVGLNGTPYLAYGSAAPTFSTIMGEALSDMGVQGAY